MVLRPPTPAVCPQESRDACEMLEQRLQEGAAALAEAAAALQSRETRESDGQVGARACVHVHVLVQRGVDVCVIF